MVAEEEIQTLVEDLSSMGESLTTTQLRNLYQECLYDEDIEICEIIKSIMQERNSSL